MHYDFEEVSMSYTRREICSICGKKCSRTQKFSQTLNPFNKNKKKKIKTRDEIYIELQIEIDNWKKVSIKHVKCHVNTNGGNRW